MLPLCPLSLYCLQRTSTVNTHNCKQNHHSCTQQQLSAVIISYSPWSSIFVTLVSFSEAAASHSIPLSVILRPASQRHNCHQKPTLLHPAATLSWHPRLLTAKVDASHARISLQVRSQPRNPFVVSALRHQCPSQPLRHLSRVDLSHSAQIDHIFECRHRSLLQCLAGSFCCISLAAQYLLPPAWKEWTEGAIVAVWSIA